MMIAAFGERDEAMYDVDVSFDFKIVPRRRKTDLHFDNVKP